MKELKTEIYEKKDLLFTYRKVKFQDKMIYIPCSTPYKILSTEIGTDKYDNSFIKYKGISDNRILYRNNNNLFRIKKETREFCNDINFVATDLKFECKVIELKDIIIPEDFQKTPPSVFKIQNRYNYYIRHNRFKSEIIIDENNVLLDGCITYELCKLMGKAYVNVVIKEEY